MQLFNKKCTYCVRLFLLCFSHRLGTTYDCCHITTACGCHRLGAKFICVRVIHINKVYSISDKKSIQCGAELITIIISNVYAQLLNV